MSLTQFLVILSQTSFCFQFYLGNYVIRVPRINAMLSLLEGGMLILLSLDKQAI